MWPNYSINHSPSNKRLTTELMTQEQANAIAEREYPTESRTMVYADQRHGKVMQTVEYHFEKERAAYAKCLMDMNPLIKAGEKMCDKLIAAAHRAGNYDYGEIEAAQEWDAALGKFTDPK